jgi:hypothetical protein
VVGYHDRLRPPDRTLRPGGLGDDQWLRSSIHNAGNANGYTIAGGEIAIDADRILT